MNWYDARMLELRNHPGLLQQAYCENTIRIGNADDLESHLALEHPILHPKHSAHATFAQLVDQSIARSFQIRRIRDLPQSFQR